MADIEPVHTVDRAAEQDEFTSMLWSPDDTRLLLITDRPRTGKSTLMRRLRYNCVWTHKVPVTLVDLKPNADIERGTIQSPIDLVDWLYEELSQAGVPFPLFEFLDAFRQQFLSPPVAQSVDSAQEYLERHAAPGSIDIEGRADVAQVSGGVVAGAYIRELHVGPRDAWATPQQERVAAQRCVEGFLKDLRRYGAKDTAVILLDSFERRHPAVRDWLVEQFIRPLSLSEDRPGRLLLVVASGNDPLPDALRDRLGADFARLVRSRPLDGWTREHLRDFLDVHGFAGLGDRELDYLTYRVQVTKDLTIGAALDLAQAFARTAS